MRYSTETIIFELDTSDNHLFQGQHHRLDPQSQCQDQRLKFQGPKANYKTENY